MLRVCSFHGYNVARDKPDILKILREARERRERRVGLLFRQEDEVAVSLFPLSSTSPTQAKRAGRRARHREEDKALRERHLAEKREEEAVRERLAEELRGLEAEEARSEDEVREAEETLGRIGEENAEKLRSIEAEFSKTYYEFFRKKDELRAENEIRKREKEIKVEERKTSLVASREKVRRIRAEQEEELRELKERRRWEEGRAAAPASPECLVCMDSMAPPAYIFQCGTGHKVCGACRPKLQVCPVR
jgi:hypothetical protein